jgi:YbgC/YbaW family acyl-CoA thioester hydrolase
VISEHRYRRRVQFAETDLAGVVHFSWYYRYAEEAEHAMWRAAGLSIAPPGEVGWPRVSASFEFHEPLRFEDEFEVLVRVTAVTDKTIRYAVVVTRGETTIATGSHTAICVSKRAGEPMRAISIPTDIAARLKVASPPA